MWKTTAAYIKTLLVHELGSSWTTAWTDQTIWAVSSRVTDPARWTVGGWIRVGPGIGKHARSAGACPHGRRWLRACYNLTTSLHFAVQLHDSSMVDHVRRQVVNSRTGAGVRWSNQWSTYATIDRIKWFAEIARQRQGCSICWMPTSSNTMRLNWHRIFQYCRHRIEMFRWPVHGSQSKCASD